MSGAPWRRLRDLEPPLGSQTRVLARVEDELARPSRRWAALAIATAGSAAVAALVWSSGRDAPLAIDPVEPPVDRAPEVVAEIEPEPAPEPEPKPPRPTIAVSAGDRISVDVDRARVEVSGPAVVRVEETSLVVTEGRVIVAGGALIKTPRCDARIDGRARIAVRDSRVDVRVSRGTAEVGPGCHVSYLDLDGPAPETAPVEPGEAEPPATSALRRQVDAFRRARRLIGVDDAAAVGALDDFIATWPDSPLRPEADAARARAARGTP